MQNTYYEEYAVINAQLKDLKNKQEELRVKILESLIEAGVGKVQTAVGSFTIAKVKTWTYSNEVEEMAEELKALKASEESTGEATCEEAPSLRFTQIKL